MPVKEFIMGMEIKRVTVEGLRGADVATIQVLTQDVLGLPLNQIHPVTVCDLFALAEVSDQVPEQLAQDLSGFVARCEREMANLPSLSDYTGALLKEDGATVPETLRLVIGGMTENADAEDTVASLSAHFADTSPSPFIVTETPSMAATAVETRKVAKKPAVKKTAAKKLDDAERREWVGQFVIGRLANYETGLKESLLVGATRHKAPWDDLTDREVRSVLRAMGREGRLKTTVGRWLLCR
jgi:hypothetical protein